MLRKLFALFLFIGAIGIFVLWYLYFFVYYTAHLELDMNVEEYRVELFSPSSARTQDFFCEQNPCIIPGISPLSYTIRVHADGYKSESFEKKFRGRSWIYLSWVLEKNAVLRPLTQTSSDTKQEAIRFLREKKKYRELFWDDTHSSEIVAEEVSPGRNIFLRHGERQALYFPQQGTLKNITFPFEILSIKETNNPSVFHMVSVEGSFLYHIHSWDFEFQYVFRDYVNDGEYVIGIVYADEVQKKQNFSFEEKGHILVLYNQRSKHRKVLMQVDGYPERIFWQQDKVMVVVDGEEYELENYR